MNYTDAIHWLKKAQDVTAGGGVSAGISALSRVWMGNYPEVSGYIIPTFIRNGDFDRALRISRWLREQQLPDGGIPMGYWNSNFPLVFDTGMVLLGWLHAQDIDYSVHTEEAIEKAVDFMEQVWEKDPQKYLPTHLVRAVWPLKLYGSKHTDSMLSFYQEHLHANGWPERAEDQQPETPLSHFIVYVARGFWECGHVELAQSLMENLPSIPAARYNAEWQAVDESICVPAVAQASILFSKLGMNAEAQRGRNYLQTLSGPWASDPIDGPYLPNTQISWSAKFIADALHPDLD